MALNPSQALNLGGQPGAYADTFSSINLFKGADAWIYSDASGNEVRGKVAVDQLGWPKSFPVVDGKPATIWANVFYSTIAEPGDYIVEWKGDVKLLPWADVEWLGTNKYRLTVGPEKPGDEFGITLRIEANDPANAALKLSGVKVYQEKYADLIAMGEKFDPEWFQAVDDYRILRTHDWQGTNYSKVTNWTISDETADQPFWTSSRAGMPYENLVQIANETRSDLWINIPHMATDSYMRKAAAYVKQHLDKDLRVYVEYTNEYWTDIFDQHPYLVNKGKELFGADAKFANAQAYGARAAEMTKIFKSVFGSEQDRLYPTVTLNHNAFNTDEAITMLTTPDWVKKGGTSPLQAGIRHLATDGYFSWFNTDPATDKMVDGWIANEKNGYGPARDFLINQIKTDLAPAWAKGRALADIHKLSFGAYEGGALLINGLDWRTGNPKYTNFNERVQLSAEMKQVYEVAIAEWQKVSSAPFAWYSDAGRWGVWGDYGLWNAPDFKPELRTLAIIEANKKLEAWQAGDERPASTFDNGLYDAGTQSADVILGTKLDDRLYGLAGDDRLAGGAGGDTLVGGLGRDKLNGGTGDDLLVGGAGPDILYGESGFDFASYRTSIETVSVDLALLKGLTGDAKGDRLVGIEGLEGGEGADQLFGDAAANWLEGGGGDDVLVGRGGADRLKGGLGSDRLTGGEGSDIFYIGPGKDTVTDWKEGDRIAVTVDGWTYGDATLVKINQVGDDTMLTLSHRGTVWTLVLEDTSAATITHAGDFVFG